LTLEHFYFSSAHFTVRMGILLAPRLLSSPAPSPLISVSLCLWVMWVAGASERFVLHSCHSAFRAGYLHASSCPARHFWLDGGLRPLMPWYPDILALGLAVNVWVAVCVCSRPGSNCIMRCLECVWRHLGMPYCLLLANLNLINKSRIRRVGCAHESAGSTPKPISIHVSIPVPIPVLPAVCSAVGVTATMRLVSLVLSSWLLLCCLP